MQKEKPELTLSYQQYIDNHTRRLQLRKQNFQQHDEDSLNPHKKSSQIKQIQKFIGKLKSQSKNHEAILSELDTLNMSKYVEEVSSIIASSVNEREIIFYTQIATKMHMEYSNMPAIMIKDLSKAFAVQVDAQEDNKARIKALFFFTVELFICGFSFSYKEVIDMIKKVFLCSKAKKTTSPSELESKLAIYAYSAPIFAYLLTHFAENLTKRTPQWVQGWETQGLQVPKFPETFPAKTKEDLTLFFTKYAAECHSLLKQVVDCLKDYESELLECLRLEGEFNKDTERNYADTVEKFVHTRRNLKQICCAISENVQFGQLQIRIVSLSQIMARYIDKVDNAQIFQDQFQKQIYTIPDLVTKQQKNITQEQYKQLKQSLDSCKNVSDCNQLCVSFNKINNKKTRKSLARDVLEYRKEYHLVTPYLCRVVAIVNVNYRDIGQAINDLVFAQYDKIKDSVANNFVANDKKSRILKYICEFTKFKVIEPDRTMQCIQSLIDNLNGYNIELLVGALENVGRFLHLSQKSANKFTFLLKKFQNIIKKKSLPVLTTSQLMNSINMLKPRREIQRPVQRVRSAAEVKAEQILKICVLDQIDTLISEIDNMMKTQQGYEAIKVQLLRRIQSYDYMNSFNYAYLLDQLNYRKLSNYVVDRSIQNLRLYLASGENQKTILWAKFLAQLYKYNMLQRPLLFSTLQSIFKITGNQIGIIHIFCNVFESCLGYLDSKKINRNNQRFLLLVKFKNFISKCRYIPMLEEFQIIDMFEEYEPELAVVSVELVNQFVAGVDLKMKRDNKEANYSEQFGKFLSRKGNRRYEEKANNDKKGKVDAKDSTQNNMGKESQVPKQPKFIPKQSRQVQPQLETSFEPEPNTFIQESKQFEKQLTLIMQQNRKDYSSRIAKQVHLQKVFDKKKQKKRDGPTMTVIGRSGTRFIRRDVGKVDTGDVQNGKGKVQ